MNRFGSERRTQRGCVHGFVIFARIGFFGPSLPLHGVSRDVN
jgi:hypothetical protein